VGEALVVRRIPRRSNLREFPVYEARTEDVLVRVVANYLPDQSDPDESKYVWGYMVEIENHGKIGLQLISRHWIITDAKNRIEEVEAPGVVGEQPELAAGEAFRYSSACPLSTDSGSMRGSYRMLTEGGETFEAMIPEFSLHLPTARRALH
jgi:ApaG protein